MNTLEQRVSSSEIIVTKDIVDRDQLKAEFYRYLKKNNLIKISRGIYAMEDVWIDPLLIAHIRCPKAVVSHDSALYYYGLVDREPAASTLTIYSGYNASKLKAAGYKVYFVKKEYLDIGKTEVVDLNGNLVPMYDVERTMCDLVRNRSNFEIQEFNTALKSYARRKEKNLARLFEYARLFRVEKLMRSYMEILL